MIRLSSSTGSGLLAIVGFVAAMTAVTAYGADPSSAMLGLVPVDQNGQVIVQDVYVGSPAQTVGLRAGDRIIAIDGKEVNTAAELIAAIGTLKAGTRIEIRASRDGWIKQVPTTLVMRSQVSGRLVGIGPALPAAPAQPQMAPAAPAQRPRGHVDANRVRNIQDPYYRARYSRW